MVEREPADRQRGTATRLHGGCTTARLFYEARGWRLLEVDVPRPGMHVLVRDAG